jgi:crotonobetainyl-CoA:carnitine CoA-transferase CaiB-like acyl-CoA transferase
MGALDGIRVADLGLLVQGPQAALMLADFGADVVKVELPNMGDQARWIFPSGDMRRAPYYHGCNRNKRSMTLDLRTAGGQAAFLKMVETLDVVISNFKPGTLDEWGLGYDVLSEINPGLVYATGSAFGPVGPDAVREGADLAGQAAGGLIMSTGLDGGDPTPVGVTIADHIASQNMVAGILAALIARGRTGRGQRVDVSLVGGQIFAQTSEYTSYFLTGELPGRSNKGHPLLHALYGIFQTADGWVAMVGVTPPNREKFYDAIGRRDLLDDPRFESLFMDEPTKLALFEEVRPSFRTKTTAEWVAIMARDGQRVAPVRTYDQVAADPQVLENGYIVPVEHPEFGATQMVGSPVRFSDTPATPSPVAPELGAHTEEVLLEIGFSWEEIEQLRTDGAF